MPITTVSAREFARDLAHAKRATTRGPVFVTNRGKPTYALLKIKPKPRKAGRPPLPKGSTKAEILRIRVTAEELRAIEAKAKAAKQTRSEFNSQQIACHGRSISLWISNQDTTALTGR
jgi:hypothetical protein